MFESKDIFIACEQETLDWTSQSVKKISISDSKQKSTITLSDDKYVLVKQLSEFLSWLDGQSAVIGWNVKPLFSYCLAKTGTNLKIKNKIYDLKILERYIDIDKSCPPFMPEAKQRLSAVVKTDSWPVLNNIYSEVFYPMIKCVVPSIETHGVLNNKSLLYSSYEIGGQVNGRSRCSNVLKSSFNPHSMSVEDKQNMRLPSFDSSFLYLDFISAEVFVLQWLSGDKVLGELLESGEDLYHGIWKRVTNLPTGDKQRKVCKDFFLPYMYGMGAESLSKRIGLDVSTASKLIDRVRSIFGTAIDWIESFKNTKAVDYFGRIRHVGDSERYLIRNFVVQSPAALIYNKKLVALNNAGFKIFAHIHDGYILTVPSREKEAVKYSATKILEEELNGLKLRVSCKVGDSLNNLN